MSKAPKDSVGSRSILFKISNVPALHLHMPHSQFKCTRTFILQMATMTMSPFHAVLELYFTLAAMALLPSSGWFLADRPPVAVSSGKATF